MVRAGARSGSIADGAAKVVEGLVFLIEAAEGRAQVGVAPSHRRAAIRARLGTPRPLRRGGPGPRSASPRLLQTPGSFKPSSNRREAAFDNAIVLAQRAIGFGESRTKDRRLREQAPRPGRSIPPPASGRPS